MGELKACQLTGLSSSAGDACVDVFVRRDKFTVPGMALAVGKKTVTSTAEKVLKNTATKVGQDVLIKAFPKVAEHITKNVPNWVKDKVPGFSAACTLGELGVKTYYEPSYKKKGVACMKVTSEMGVRYCMHLWRRSFRNIHKTPSCGSVPGIASGVPLFAIGVKISQKKMVIDRGKIASM